MSAQAHILVVDDEPSIRQYLKILLERQGYEVSMAADAASALVMLQEKDYPLALIDVRMPGINGITLLRQMREASIETEVIILTGYGTVETAVEAMKLGAYDYVTKPLDGVTLCLLISKALEKAGLQRQNVRLRVALEHGQSEEPVIIGESACMQQVRKLIAQVAAVDATVLILGETGTGKDIVARAIHEHSRRSSDVFLALNCATIPDTLLPSELFGHEKDAFTGANQLKIGVFEAADQGTLFLDELAEMPQAMQVELLRILETGEFRRIGSNHARFTRARIIAATNKRLDEEVAKGDFRSDLFYRLNVITIQIPPLRDRRGDILPLAHHFLAKAVARFHKPVQGFTEGAQKVLQDYSWPGNVRELRNVIERAALLCEGDQIASTELHLTSLAPGNNPTAFYSERWTLEQLERHHIRRAFERNNEQRNATAEDLGISVRTLYRKLRRYDLIEPDSIA